MYTYKLSLVMLISLSDDPCLFAYNMLLYNNMYYMKQLNRT